MNPLAALLLALALCVASCTVQAAPSPLGKPPLPRPIMPQMRPVTPKWGEA